MAVPRGYQNVVIESIRHCKEFLISNFLIFDVDYRSLKT